MASGKNEHKITIVLPTKDEGEGIAELIRILKPYGDEILVVDGHSMDSTREVAETEGARVILDNKKGKGDAIKVAIKEARGDILVFIDADGSHEPSDIPLVLEPLLEDRADLVVASRAKGGSDEFKMRLDHLIRQVGTDLATTLINYRYNADLTDILNGFRAIKRPVALNLNLKANDFDIEEELITKCLKKGYRIAEVASHEYCRKWGKSKLPTTKAWKFLLRLFIELI